VDLASRPTASSSVERASGRASIDKDFHVVGTVPQRAWVDAAVTDPPLHRIQTVTIARPGLYPFVTHSFASVDMGAVGLLNVGDVAGTVSH
jgi:hypothetical protein